MLQHTTALVAWDIQRASRAVQACIHARLHIFPRFGTIGNGSERMNHPPDTVRYYAKLSRTSAYSGRSASRAAIVNTLSIDATDSMYCLPIKFLALRIAAD